MSTANQEQFEELIDSFKTAMLVTSTPQGQLRSRPMALAEYNDDGLLYFATTIESGKVNEILRHPGVNVAMQNSSAYLSVSGQAEVMDDRDKIDELWDASWNLWFEGKDDPNLALIKVHASEGEYWNFETKDKLAFMMEAGKAMITGDTVDYEGEHGKVRVA